MRGTLKKTGQILAIGYALTSTVLDLASQTTQISPSVADSLGLHFLPQVGASIAGSEAARSPGSQNGAGDYENDKRRKQ